MKQVDDRGVSSITYDRKPEFVGMRYRRGHSVILIDDGLATGSTMRAAVVALRQQRPSRLVVAVPVAAESTCSAFRSEVDEIICARMPEPFYAVGLWYEDFSQTTDDEVRELLRRAAPQESATSARRNVH